MKKLMALLLVFLMILSAAGAEDTSFDLLAQIQGKLFEFSSGAGGWSTELTVGENGTFTGNFHDSEMGEIGEGYPNGTVYGCTFHGQFTDPAAIDEYSWQVQISVELDEGQAQEAIEDDIRYVTSAPYGVEKATSVTFFVPGTPVDRLPEGFLIWSHLQEIAPEATGIPYYAIWNEEDESGFITYPAYEERDLPAYIYTGEDPIEGAIVNTLLSDGHADLYMTEPGYVTIPCPIILKTVMIDDSHAIVYGNFWLMNYVRQETVLFNISGGETAAVVTLEKVDGEWQVTAMEEPGEGEEYVKDIERFADGDEELEAAFFAAEDLTANQEIRTQFIKAYVEANGLDITAYQDYGWDPVELK